MSTHEEIRWSQWWTSSELLLQFLETMTLVSSRKLNILWILNVNQCIPLDFGLDTLAELIPKCNFPWIVSNVIDSESGQALGGAKVFHTLDWQGRKIGVIGLVEKEWLETVTSIDQDHIDYTDFVDAASLLAEDLKRKGI